MNSQPTTDIEFTVYGVPATAGSKRAFMPKNGSRPIVVDDSGRKGKEWRSVVQDAALEVFSGPLLDCPLLVRFVFYEPRASGHFGTGRNSGKLKASAPGYPAKRPDVLKLARAVEDALTGIVWKDDARIVDEILAKRYGEPARCEVTITVLE